MLLGESQCFYWSTGGVRHEEALAQCLEGRDDEFGGEGQELMSALAQNSWLAYPGNVGPCDLAVEVRVGPEEEVLGVSGW